MRTGKSEGGRERPNVADIDVRVNGDVEIELARPLEVDESNEDMIQAGPSHRRAGLRFPALFDRLSLVPVKGWLAILVVALVAAVGISTHADRQGESKRPAPPQTAVQGATVQSGSDAALTAMVASAVSPVRLQDYAIEDNSRLNCVPSQPGSPDPILVIAALVTQDQPSYVLQDSSEGIEQSGICVVRVRFVGSAGATLIITVIPPPNELTSFVALRVIGESSALDVRVNDEGWSAEVGATGPTGSLPTEYDLNAIATDSRLPWSPPRTA